MTANDFINAGIAIDDTPTAVLQAETALDWIARNTTLTIDKTDIVSLPAGAKLFVLKFGEVMSANLMVTSESMAGMSQSFNTEARNNLIYNLALDCIGEYLKPTVTFRPAKSRWNNGH